MQIINLPGLLIACSIAFNNAADSAVKIEQNGSKWTILIQFPFSLYTFYQIARGLTKLKPNEIFNDFAISWDSINEIDPNFFILKIWTRN